MTTVTNEQLLTEWEQWHAEREALVTAPHGIAANTGTTWLGDEATEVAGLPGTWRADGGKAVSDALGVALAPGQEHTYGDKLIKVISPRPATIAVRVFDPEAPTRVGLTGIGAFEASAEWVASGHFEAASADSTIAIQHYDGAVTDDALAGTLHLDVAGHHLHLSAWPSPKGAGQLELTFADTTNGVTTKQFRFLTLPAPDADGNVVVDFNRAYLPPCALGEGYLCPIPPQENRLPFGVEAGERFPLR